MKTKRKNKLIIIAAVVLSFLVVLPLLTGIITTSNKKKNTGGNTSVVTVEEKVGFTDVNIQWRDRGFSLALVSGEFHANVESDKLFVNVNGLGCEELEFNKTKMRKTDGSVVYKYTLSPNPDVLASSFDDDITVKADIYLEYNGICCLVDSQNVNIRSCWIGPY